MMNISFTHAPEAGRTYRESFNIEYGGSITTMCTVFTMTSHWEGIQPPSVRFLLLWEDGSEVYASHTYTPAKDGETKSWRIPPFYKRGVFCRAEITVPQGSALCVDSIDAAYEPYAVKGSDAELDAHLGFWGAAPENTEAAFRLAGMCGFHNCITVPKRTKDGVYVCIHDDTIARTARDAQGNVPQPDLAVENMTYEELQDWDFGIKKHPIFAGERIPLLEDYFRICKAYDMKPIFSVHPCFSREEWTEIRDIAERQGILGKLRMKSANIEVLQKIYSVFGNDMEGYILWNKTYSDDMPKKLAGLGLDLTKTRGTIEAMHLPQSPWKAEYVRTVKDNGFNASGLACWEYHTDAYYKELIAMGVSEFTEDFHCSGALNW